METTILLQGMNRGHIGVQGFVLDLFSPPLGKNAR